MNALNREAGMVMMLAFSLVLVLARKSSERESTLSLFNPDHPVVGEVSSDDVAHVRLKVHDVAFMIRALRTVVKDTRPDIEKEKEPLTKRFPKARIPEDTHIHHHCRKDFISCVSYLSSKAKDIGISTENDLLTLQEGANMCSRKGRLKIFCSLHHVVKTKLETINNTFAMYQMTVTAMQYMCWYTMHGVPYLAHLLQCDSTNPSRKRPDGDARANSNSDPFGCALYSFCPNPCCGGLRELDEEKCWSHVTNPCRLHGIRLGIGCEIPRDKNLNYHQLVDRSIHFSCDCGQGREYNVNTDMCMLHDHCANPNACPKPNQRCLNLYEGYTCRCDPEYKWKDSNKSCVPIYLPHEWEIGEEVEEREEEMPFFKWLHSLIDKSLKVTPEPEENYKWALL